MLWEIKLFPSSPVEERLSAEDASVVGASTALEWSTASPASWAEYRSRSFLLRKRLPRETNSAGAPVHRPAVPSFEMTPSCPLSRTVCRRLIDSGVKECRPQWVVGFSPRSKRTSSAEPECHCHRRRSVPRPHVDPRAGPAARDCRTMYAARTYPTGDPARHARSSRVAAAASALARSDTISDGDAPRAWDEQQPMSPSLVGAKRVTCNCRDRGEVQRG